MFLRGRKKESRNRNTLRSMLCLELLEGRRLLTCITTFNNVDVNWDKFYVNGNALYVTATDHDDVIAISDVDDGGITVALVEDGDGECFRSTTPSANITHIFVHGKDGDDNINLSGMTPGKWTALLGVKAYGDDNDDEIVGSNISTIYDHLLGGKGHDYIRGLTGKSTIEGGPDEDHLFGGNKQDTIFGEAGSDWIEGGVNNDGRFDQLYGGTEVDVIFTNTAGGGGDGNPTPPDYGRSRSF